MATDRSSPRQQPPHDLLMIPGPTEFADDVLEAMGTPGTSHMDPRFAEAFGDVLDKLLPVFGVHDPATSLPFVIAGAGTLGWDITAANFCQPGDRALVINIGYFGDRFGDCLRAYGLDVEMLTASSGLAGDLPTVADLRERLLAAAARPYKLITITHVDTSTGVRAPLREYAACIRSHSADSLIAVDGVCSVGGEALEMTDWDLDIAFTGSQKALGVPPGLLVAAFRTRALTALHARTHPVPAYFINLQHWIPIIAGYRARRPLYFSTPPVQLIFALHTALRGRILASEAGVRGWVLQHHHAATAFRAALQRLGCRLVTNDPAAAANTLSAIRYPHGVEGPKLIGFMKQQGIVVAGGLHKQISQEYFRIGHMGIAIAKPQLLRTTLSVLAAGLQAQGHSVKLDEVLSEFDKFWSETQQAHL